MASNKMKFVEKVRKDYDIGLPDGLGGEFMRNLPVLFARISELERALIPFARIAERERKFGKELVEVYRKDCEQAFDMVAYDKAQPLPATEIWYPAE